ncbi:MAG: sulfite oxidase [Gemmatimonadales bacterium]
MRGSPDPSPTPGGLSRRDFVGAASGVLLAGCTTSEKPEASPSAAAPAAAPPPPQPWVKDPAPFIRHPTNLETRLENLPGLLTPNELFFVRNHASTPRLDAAAWRLRVDGDGVERPFDLSYDDLMRLPSRSVVAYLECAGNGRKFFAEIGGKAATGGQWATGAVGCAEWTGVPLALVLERAGVRRGAVDVLLHGLDEAKFSRPMPLARAREDDTLLAFAMNGAPLPPDHGFPVRALVPGWVGSNSVKWLGRIEVSMSRVWVKTNTASYVLVGEQWPADRYKPALGAPVTRLNVKSALALPRPGRLAAGVQRLRGFAHAPSGIARVEWSPDGGTTWKAARLDPAPGLAWNRFDFEWNAVPGEHRILTRATDRQGNRQPSSVPWNEQGYLFNAALPHSVTVA